MGAITPEKPAFPTIYGLVAEIPLNGTSAGTHASTQTQPPALVEMLGMWLYLSGRTATARGVPELPAEVRFRGRHLLHARMWPRLTRSAIDAHADERAGEEVVENPHPRPRQSLPDRRRCRRLRRADGRRPVDG